MMRMLILISSLFFAVAAFAVSSNNTAPDEVLQTVNQGDLPPSYTESQLAENFQKKMEQDLEAGKTSEIKTSIALSNNLEEFGKTGRTVGDIYKSYLTESENGSQQVAEARNLLVKISASNEKGSKIEVTAEDITAMNGMSKEQIIEKLGVKSDKPLTSDQKKTLEIYANLEKQNGTKKADRAEKIAGILENAYSDGTLAKMTAEEEPPTYDQSQTENTAGLVGGTETKGPEEVQNKEPNQSGGEIVNADNPLEPFGEIQNNEHNGVEEADNTGQEDIPSPLPVEEPMADG